MAANHKELLSLELQALAREAKVETPQRKQVFGGERKSINTTADCSAESKFALRD